MTNITSRVQTKSYSCNLVKSLWLLIKVRDSKQKPLKYKSISLNSQLISYLIVKELERLARGTR